MHEPSESDVFAFLADPATHGGVEVRRIDTHAAAVFLAGERALKVKKAVRFPFLDFSTLEKRRAACLAELEVNQAFAPQLYRRVLAITRAPDGRLALDGGGEPVEWAVEMQRFDENQTLDHIAERQGIDTELADKLGRSIAAMHARAKPVDVEAWLAALKTFLEQNAVAFREAPALFPPHEAAALDQAAHTTLADLRPLLLARGRRGLVRRGHGDLHLANIAQLDGQPIPFDAIEFDPMIAAGDLLYDLAFLLMDLLERELQLAANVVLNRYLTEWQQPEDLDGLAALPFFMSLRAAIRAKVMAARAQQVDAEERPPLAQAAKVYFALAARLLSPPPPILVAIGGLSGTGKSTLARALAPRLLPAPGAVIVRSDVERKALFGVAETHRLPAEAYRPEVSAAVYARLAVLAGRVIAARHSAIVDAVFARAEERAALAARAAQENVKFRGFFLVADVETRIGRVTGRKPDVSDANVAVVRQQESYRLNHLDWQEIDASGSLQDTLALLYAALEEADGPRPEPRSAGPIGTNVPRS